MKNKQAKFHISALLLAVVLLFANSVSVVYAADTAEIAFGQVSGKCGEQVIVPVTITGNPGIASLRFRIEYDTTALTFVSAEKGELMRGGTLSAEYQTADRELAVTWFDVKNVTGDGVLFHLVFEVSDSAGGQYPISVSYLPEDIVNASWQQKNVTVVDGWVQTGSAVTGTVTSFGESDEEVIVALMRNGTEISRTATTSGAYKLTSVTPGEYSLVVSKLNHVTRTYEITVSNEDVTQNVKIHLKGDISGDGRINVVDVAKANAHAKRTVFIDGYELACADINGDGRVNVADVAKMNAHAKKTVYLW